MQRMIRTNGADIVITGRPHGGYRVTQGPSYLLLADEDARQLIDVLNEILANVQVD